MKNELDTKPRKNNKLLGAFLAILLIVTSFFSGLEIGKNTNNDLPLQASLFSLFSPTTIGPDDSADLKEFWRVWNLLDDKFVTASGTPDTTEKIRGAIAGLVDSYGDPYTVYMPPADATYFSEDISGNFGGVGMEVGLRDKLITVISPLPDTPAEKAGIESGDIITKIGDETTEKMTVDEAVRLIRGEKGSEVHLTLYRKSTNEFKDVSMVRENIKIPTIEIETKGDVFIVSLFSFNALSETKMHEAVQQFKDGNYKKFILDLRGNPGGYLDSAVNIASYFLPAGKVVVRENFGDTKAEDVYRTSGSQMVNIDPENFVILIDGGSASASEILAGALSEHGAATTIGETTFGKGSVQELVNLPDSAALKVTIARWLTPEGVSFSNGGLEPNIKVPRDPAMLEKGIDEQKEAALKWLAGQKNLGEKVSFQF